MAISYKYPIFPDKATQQKLAEALDACRWLYNKLLEKMNEARDNGIRLTTYETQNMIPSLKLENPRLNLVYSKALQMVNYTLHSNLASLAALKRNGYDVGPLRFKTSTSHICDASFGDEVGSPTMKGSSLRRIDHQIAE